MCLRRELSSKGTLTAKEQKLTKDKAKSSFLLGKSAENEITKLIPITLLLRFNLLMRKCL